MLQWWALVLESRSARRRGLDLVRKGPAVSGRGNRLGWQRGSGVTGQGDGC